MEANDIFAEYNAIEWKTYDTFTAIATFRDFWQEMERLIAAAADASEKKGTDFDPGTGDPTTDYFMKRQVARHLHDEVATPALRYGAVITLFAVVERELKRYGDNLATEKKHPLAYRDLKGSLFDQLGRYAAAYHDLRLQELEGYSEIRILQKVRNCLVHAYGEPSMMSAQDEKFLLGLNSQAKGIEVIAAVPLMIYPVFIENAVLSANRLFLDLFQKTGWKVNEKWLPRLPAGG